MFADDVKIFIKINDLSEARQLQKDIDTIFEWCSTNKLQINANKCFMISFTRRSEVTYQYFNYNINGTTINRVNDVRDLGITLDSKLNFNVHIKNIINKASKMLGFISRSLYKFKNLDTYCTLYNCYVRSNMEFGSSKSH